MGRFTGWPQDAFEVLLRLDGDPSPSEREALRPDRERLVRQPMIALLNDLADADAAYDDFFVWGFRTMLWPWQRQVGVIRLQRGVEHSVAFDLDGLAVTGTGWFADAEHLPRYRQAVASEPAGTALTGLLQELLIDGGTPGGDVLKRGPRGLPADHPRADLLRHRTLSVSLPLGCEPWLHTADAAAHVRATLDRLRPLAGWFAEQVFTEPAAAAHPS